MFRAIQTWGILTLALGAAGLIGGSIGGLGGLVVAGTIDGVAAFAGKAFWSLIVLVPLALWLLTALNLEDKETAPLYTSAITAYGILIGAGLVGGLLASAAYFVPATNWPFIFKQFDTIQMRQSLYNYIGWNETFWVTVVSTLSGLVIAVWATRKAQTRPSELKK